MHAKGLETHHLPNQPGISLSLKATHLCVKRRLLPPPALVPLSALLRPSILLSVPSPFLTTHFRPLAMVDAEPALPRNKMHSSYNTETVGAEDGGR